jgi:hypothetical protein
VLVRVPGYNTIRFWKKNGLEVGNPDHYRRGWRIDLKELKDGHPTVGIDTDV